MNWNFTLRVLGCLPFLAALLSGCSTTIQHSIEKVVPERAEYKSSESLPPLEIPPDLSSATIRDSMPVPSVDAVNGTTYSDYQTATRKVAARPTEVLPEPEGVRMERVGDERWLVFEGEPEQVWPGVREFLLGMGFTLKVEDPSIGIMETDWAEDRADLPQGGLRSWLGKFVPQLRHATTRDKFRVRLERGVKPGTTELYISHRGATVKPVRGNNKQDEFMGWQPRPSDPELEAEMLTRIMVHFGVREERAHRMMASAEKGKERAKMIREGDGSTSLALLEDFARAWRRTGLALDRVGFTVEDWDRTKGVYYVRYVDPERAAAGAEEEGGWLSKLKFWGGDEGPQHNNSYLISLNRGQGSTTQVVVLNKQGERDTSATADRILSLLHEQLR